MTNQTCTNTPIGVTLSVIGGKWKLLILWHVKQKPMRFNQLMREMNGITQKMLTQQLRELEEEGLISRKIFAEIPPHVEYSLTKYGASLDPVLEYMCKWGEKHIKVLKRRSQAVTA
jgi:DNA-binding HxlR family transcriptional regulator